MATSIEKSVFEYMLFVGMEDEGDDENEKENIRRYPNPIPGLSMNDSFTVTHKSNKSMSHHNQLDRARSEPIPHPCRARFFHF